MSESLRLCAEKHQLILHTGECPICNLRGSLKAIECLAKIDKPGALADCESLARAALEEIR